MAGRHRLSLYQWLEDPKPKILKQGTLGHSDCLLPECFFFLIFLPVLATLLYANVDEKFALLVMYYRNSFWT